jgi:hypothetical protein
MLRDIDFAKDVEDLIQDKQKKSAFVYIKNHWALIQNAIDSGSRIADIHQILLKNGISITLATLRLYVHRLRHDVNLNAADYTKNIELNNQAKNIEHTNAEHINVDFVANNGQTAILKPVDNNENNNDTLFSETYDVPSMKKIQEIRTQTPNLEELSKAFKIKK